MVRMLCCSPVHAQRARPQFISIAFSDRRASLRLRCPVCQRQPHRHITCYPSTPTHGKSVAKQPAASTFGSEAHANTQSEAPHVSFARALHRWHTECARFSAMLRCCFFFVRPSARPSFMSAFYLIACRILCLCMPAVFHPVFVCVVCVVCIVCVRVRDAVGSSGKCRCEIRPHR